MLLSIVFSFRNEESNIPELVKRVSAACVAIDDLSYELIFVNDASTDNSLEILMRLRTQFPICIVNMSRKFGVAHCCLAGFAQARGDALIYMDSDLQDPPEIIPEMVKKYREGADVVHTTRFVREGENPIKMWITKKAYQIINYFSEIPLPKNTGDFKLLSARVYKEVLALNEYDPYMRGLSVWVGFKQDFIIYKREPRYSGDAKFPLFSGGPIKEFIRGLTAYSAAPLYISFFMGLTVSLIAGLLILWSLLIKFLGLASPGASGIMIATAFFSGIILMTNGIMGIYIAKIYYEVKGRPRYIVESMHPAPSSSSD